MRILSGFKLLSVAAAAMVLLFTPTLSAAPQYVSGELVIKMESGYSIDLVNTQYGTQIAQHLPQLDVYLLLAAGTTDLDSLAILVEEMSEVQFCHPNYLVDPLQPVQSSLPVSDEQYQGDYDGQEAFDHLGLGPAHSVCTGDGVQLAVLDGGVNYLHPVLEDYVDGGYDYVDDDGDPFDEPGGSGSGHGTFVAGITHLVAPDAVIKAYRVCDTSGEGNGYIVAEAILQAVNDGCRVINLSLVTTAVHEAIAEAAAYAAGQEVLVVAAAGNGYDGSAHYPASDPNVLSVAAVDTLDLLADFSSYGPHVDVCAPGTNIYSPYLDSSYVWWGGTSFAAPFVAAQAAMLMDYRPEATRQEVIDAILSTAVNIDYLNPDLEGMLGAGLIDPLGSIIAVRGGASLFRVPGDYATIQEAVDAAYHGDTILVGPGTYYGRTEIHSKTLYLIGEQGADETILRPAAYIPQLMHLWGTFLPGGGIKGFTFEAGGSSSYPALSVSGASPTITENIFRDNMPDGNTGQYVVSTTNGSPLFIRNLFINNLGKACLPVVNGVHVINNTFDGNRVAIYAGSSPVDRVGLNNIITNSSAYGIDATGWTIFTQWDYNDLWNNAQNYHYSLIAGPNDFHEDPAYVDPVNGDYRLLPGSPCIDAGHPDSLYNDPDGSRNDVGALPAAAIDLPIARALTVGPVVNGDVVTIPEPWFSWDFFDTLQESQAQRWIQVSSDSGFAVIDMWDETSAGASQMIPAYAGSPLVDGQRYYVHLKVSDNTNGWGDWMQTSFRTGFATVINVPGDWGTIQQAVDEANDGDTVLVAPGTYTENINLGGKNISLLSADGAAVTVLEPAVFAQPVIAFNGGEDTTAVLDGFTIQNGETGISALLAAPKVTNCAILNCTVFGFYGRGCPGAVVRNCLFDGDDAGLYVVYGSVYVQANTFINGNRIAIDIHYCDSSEVSGNISARNGYCGIQFIRGVGNRAIGNTVYGNGVTGIYALEEVDLNLRNNLVVFNRDNHGFWLRGLEGEHTSVEYNNSFGNLPLDYYEYPPGAGCLALDPMLADTSGVDFALLPGSPCMDAGDPDPVYNDPDGSRSDIGAVPAGPLNLPVAAGISFSPLGTGGHVASYAPDIAWNYHDTSGGVQTKYHIEVGTDPDWSVAEMWNSGDVVSSISNVAYSGAPLQDIRKYYVRIRLHNGTDWGDWCHGSFTVKTVTLVAVPADAPTIREGVNWAVDGDTILVAPGAYAELIQFSGKSILLTSSDGPEVTFVDPLPNEYNIVKYLGIEDTTSVLRGFTLQNGGQLVDLGRYSGPKIVGNRLLNSSGGVDGDHCEGVIVRGNYFENITRPVAIEGGSCFLDSNTVVNCSITDYDACLEGLWVKNSRFSYNCFAHNSLTYSAAAIRLVSSDSCLVMNNTIACNYASDSGSAGVLLTSGSDANHIVNNIVAFNANMSGMVEVETWLPNTYEYNDVFSNSAGDYNEVTPGLGSISADPMFTDTANNDFSLTTASPCIDAGHPGIQYVDPDGTINDMGAIAFDGPYNLPIPINIDVDPGDLSHVVGPNPTIHWTFLDTVGTQYGYEIEVGIDNEWTDAEMWVTGQVFSSDTSAIYAGATLVSGTSYYLRMRLNNGSVWGDWRGGLFHRNAAPTMPVPVRPQPGDTAGANTGFYVLPGSDADGDFLWYDFEVYADSALTDFIAGTTAPGGSDTVNSGPLGGVFHFSEYWWRVRSNDGYETSNWTAASPFFAVAAIVLTSVTGADLDAGTFDCGRTVDFRFRIANEYSEYLVALANGMRIYSPDGAVSNVVNAFWDLAAFDWWQIYDLIVVAQIRENLVEDTVSYGASVLVKSGLAPGESHPAWRLQLHADCSEGGKTICIDSASGIPPGQMSWHWILRHDGGVTETVVPVWEGPLCFTIRQCCLGIRGDVDSNGDECDIADLIYLVDYMFHWGPQPPCLQEANLNGDPDEQIDISDLTYIVDYMFTGGEVPCDCDSIVSIPPAKILGSDPITLSASVDNDTTVIVLNSPMSLRGVQMQLKGADPFEPLGPVDREMELFYAQQDSAVMVGLLDQEGLRMFKTGETVLLTVPGQFELVEARVANLDHHTIIPAIKGNRRPANIPQRFELSQNYPNPFNPATSITFGLPQAVYVELEIYNILGQKVRTLKNETMPAGWHTISWNGTNGQSEPAASGVYFYRITAGTHTESKKMLLLK